MHLQTDSISIPGSLLEMLNLRPHPRAIESTRSFKTLMGLLCTRKFEKCWSVIFCPSWEDIGYPFFHHHSDDVMGRICGCPGMVIDTVWSLPAFLVLCLPNFLLTTFPILTVIFEQRGPRGETLNSVKSLFQLYLFGVVLWHVWNSKWAWQRMKWVFQILPSDPSFWKSVEIWAFIY